MIATIDTELLLLTDLKADFARKGIQVMVSNRAFPLQVRFSFVTASLWLRSGSQRYRSCSGGIAM